MRIKVVVIILYVLILTIPTSCKSRRLGLDDTSVIVSIQPLKWVAERITDGRVNIEVLLPDNTNPETFSPTPKQLIKTDNAIAIFTTGLIDFEVELMHRVNTGHDNKVVNLSSGVELLDGVCSHSHNHSSHDKHHKHGIDPHIWTSPEQLKIVSKNMLNALIELMPEYKELFLLNYQALQHDLNEASNIIRDKINSADCKFFIIYHPALTYYAKDYGIEQIPLEKGGKEPTPTYLVDVVKRVKEKSKANRIHILYQQEHSRSIIESFAHDINAIPVAFNPLAEDILNEILFVTNVITGNGDN